MAQSGDDCYFFYYSKCSKGALCQFRHQEAALGTEAVCALWKEGRCFRPVCSFRHMDILKNRSQIPCYWEKQPGGCQKPHCVFLHTAAPWPAVAAPVKESASILPTPDPLERTTVKAMRPPAVTGQAQRLGQELGNSAKDVPSPKVEQLVINPFEEESDQESINGTPQKASKPETNVQHIAGSPDKTKAISLTKRIYEDGNNLGIKTLEEIQREKALQSLFRNRSTLKDAEEPLAASHQPTTEMDVLPSTRRVVLTSEADVVVPSESSSKQIVVEREKQKEEVNKACKNMKVTSPPAKGIVAQCHIKDRLGLKLSGALDRKECKDDRNERPSDAGKKQASVSKAVKRIIAVSEADSDFSVGQKEEPMQMNRATLSRVDSDKDLGVIQPPPKSCRVDRTGEPQVIIKSLSEIKKEKSLRHREAEKSSSTDSRKPVRRTRPALEIYQPPVRARVGVSSGQSAKNIVDENPSVDQKHNGQKLSEEKKSEAWLHVKSFAEIMTEKRERKLQKSADRKSGESREEAKYEENKISDGGQTASRRQGCGVLRKTAENGQLGVTTARNKTAVKQPGVSETTANGSDVPPSTNGAQAHKHKFVPIVFDLEQKPALHKRTLSQVNNSNNKISEPVQKRVKSASNLVLESDQEKETFKSPTSSIPTTASSIASVSLSAVAGSLKTVEKSDCPTLDLATSCSTTEKSNLSTPDFGVAKSRRLGQRLSSVGASQTELKGRSYSKPLCANQGSTAEGKASENREEEEDDFTKQLDDLMVDISCIPSEDFAGFTDESQNDDDLLLEIQELLS